MQPPYLSSDRLSLRAMVASDAAVAADWFPAVFPVNAAQASQWLREQHGFSPWDGPPRTWLTIVRLPTDTLVRGQERNETVVGGVAMSHPRGRTTDVQVWIAPSVDPAGADHLQAEVVRILVPWARDELESMVVTVSIGSDQPASIAAAQELGMLQAARLREHLARPGRRADLLWYQALNGKRLAPDPAAATTELNLISTGPVASGNGEDGPDA